MVAKRLQYRYDTVGNKVGMTDADGGLFTYTYDVMRRLTGVINPLGERTTYVYDLNGRRTSAQLANGTRTSYSYDQGSRVQQIHTLKSNNSTVAKFDYAYDNNGRRTSVLEADGSRVTWTYDGTSQVTSEWRTGTSPFRHTFVYDTRGNRTLKIEDGARTTLAYDAANQLSSSEDAGGTTNYTYDANGNQHVTVTPGGSRMTQIWDYENRLVKTLQPGGGVFTMAYDADGLRARKETPTETKLFVWDDQNYLAETNGNGVTQAAYTTEPLTYGNTISHRSGGATTTYHFDALAAARALTNSSETVLESYNYSAFGTILGAPTLLTPFLWGGLVGYYWDADLATQYIRARHYKPSIARWISLDPIGFAGGDANLFRYVSNSPTSGANANRVQLTASYYDRLTMSLAYVAMNQLALPRMCGSRNECNAKNEATLNISEPSIYEWMQLFAVDPSGFEGFGNSSQLGPPWLENEQGIWEWREKCLLMCLGMRGNLTGSVRECRQKCMKYAATPYFNVPRRMEKRLFPRVCWNPCPKHSRIQGYPGRTVPRGGITVVDGGSYKKDPIPDPENWITAGGASPCAIVVVMCDDGVTRMHFGVPDSTESIGLIIWGTNCRAIVCGGDNKPESNCLHTDVLLSLKLAGVKVERVSPAQGCGVDGSGNWIESDDIEGMPK